MYIYHRDILAGKYTYKTLLVSGSKLILCNIFSPDYMINKPRGASNMQAVSPIPLLGFCGKVFSFLPMMFPLISADKEKPSSLMLCCSFSIGSMTKGNHAQAAQEA